MPDNNKNNPNNDKKNVSESQEEKVVSETLSNDDVLNETNDIVEAPKPLSVKEAKELVDKNLEKTLERIDSIVSRPSSIGPLGVVTASQSDITDELEKGGPAFGNFIKQVGLGIAEAQKALDDNMVAAAKAISEASIDVIAVYEQVINDEDGSIGEGKPMLQKLPLINYLMPTAYQWSRVYLQADMKVSEFNSANGINIKSKTTSFNGGLNASFNPLAFAVGGGLGGSRRTSDYSQDSSYSQDSAAGTMHMEATLEPRSDVELPKPYVYQRGPKLKVLIGTRVDLDKDGNPTSDPAAVAGRKLTLTAELRKTNGEPHSGKILEVSIDNPTLNFSGSGTTDNTGKYNFTVMRTGAAFDKTSYVQAIVRVWFGLVSDTIAINI